MNQSVVLRTARSVCPHDCPSACALDVDIIDINTIGRVRGAKDDPYTAGVICEIMNEDGTMAVLRAGRRKQLLAEIEMDAPRYSPPALVGDALYLATANRLYLIAAKH